MPSRVARNNINSSNMLISPVTSGLICHYDAWTNAKTSEWKDLGPFNFTISAINNGLITSPFSNSPGVGIAYKLSPGLNIILPNINANGSFSTIAETIELYIYPDSSNCVWLSETSGGINTGWHTAKIVIYKGYFYLLKWNGYLVSCLLGKAILNAWNHVVWRQTVDNSVIQTNFSYGYFVSNSYSVVVNTGSTITLPAGVYIKPGIYNAYCTLTTTYNYNGVTGRLRLVTANNTIYSLWIQNNGTGTSTTTGGISMSLSPNCFPINIQLEVYYPAWYLTNTSGSVVINYGPSRLDGFLNGHPSSFEQCNSRQTPWLNNGGTTVYRPCIANDTTSYGTTADPSGYINTIRIYNRALTNSEILQNFSCFKNRYYVRGLGSPNYPPSLIVNGNNGSNDFFNYSWTGGYWGLGLYYDDQSMFNLNYNTYQNIGVDFDFYFNGVNYGRGQNGSIWIHTLGCLCFGPPSTTSDWQASTGKGFLLGWSSDRALPEGTYTDYISQESGYSERAFTYQVKSDRLYYYWPGYGYFDPPRNYWYNFDYYKYSIRLLRTNNRQYIDIRCSQSGTTPGRWQYSDGQNLYNINALIAGQSMVIVSGPYGEGWTVFNPYYINDGITSDPINNYNVFMRYDALRLSREFADGDVITSWANTGNYSANDIDLTATSVGNPKLTFLGRNSLVDFTNLSQTEQYFTIPQFNASWVGTEGITVAFVGTFYNYASYSWSRVFDFSNGPGNDNVIFAKYYTSNNPVLSIRTGSSVKTEVIMPGTDFDGGFSIFIISAEPYQSTQVAAKYRSNRYNSGNVYGPIYTNNGAMSTTYNNYTNYIGKSAWADGRFYGNIGEILIIRGALNDTQSGDLLTYLKNKWYLNNNQYY
jgi:hypothetical protein